jgi:signal transduction histidine kinase/ligand-binding sensor domain-containing protein/DNA-binding response OmpR family regulator
MDLIIRYFFNLVRRASSYEHCSKTRSSQLTARSFLALLLIANSTTLHSQPSSLFFSNLTTRDGLPSNIISAVTQDQNDFMWIGTANGLCRFDGYRFITFKKQDSKNSLPANEISALLVVGGHLWIGTWKGLCRLNTTTFEIERIDLGPNTVIRTLHQDRSSVVWIGTATGLVRYSEKGINVFNSQNSGLSHNTVRSIYSDHAGNLWVGTYDKLNKLGKGQSTFVSFDLKGNYKPSLKNNLICDIKQDKHSDSLLWIGAETGLCHFNIFTNDVTHYSEKNIPFSNEVIKNIYTDQGGHLWLGTDFGLNVFDPKTKSNTVYFHNPQQAYSIANNVVWEIVEDKGGVVWFVTSNGLARLNKFRNYYSYHEVSQDIAGQRIGNQVKSAMMSSKGILWLATLHGILRIDPQTGAQETFDTKSIPERRILLNNVYAVEEDNLGRVWIGTAGGINVWDDDKKKMYAITSSPTNGLITNYISKFTKGTDGSFWVSAWEGGLFKVTGDYRNIESIAFERAGDFGSEKNVSGSNAIWAIDYNELHRIDLTTHRDTKVSSFNAFSSKNGISCIYFSRKGSLWAGTLNGLIEYQPASDSTILHPINTGNDVTLASLNEDRHGNIWGITNGLALKFDVTSGLTEFFPLDKDLPIKSFFDGCSAATAEGEIIFGGDNGYIVLQPDARPTLYNPKVFITTLEVNNEKLGMANKSSANAAADPDIAFVKDINVNYQQRSLTFEFSALHFWQPALNVYAYKLEGFDKQWNFVSGVKNFAVYANLSPGSYTFFVKATNNYGIWSDQVASMNVIVKPPLFLSTPFIALYIVLGLALIYAALHFYSARLYLKNEVKIVRLEKEHAEEIAFTKQQFFTNISHELRTPISLILPPIQQTLKRETLDKESRSLLKLAEKNSYRLLRVVNQILDFRKLEHDSLELKITSFDLIEFCRDLHMLFSDKAARNEIHFTLHPTVNSCRIWADMDKIETVLYNLLSNAFKFTTRHGSIDLAISLKSENPEFPKGSVEIKITDTGIGIAPDEQKKIFDRFYQTAEAKQMESGSGIGLTLASEYARLHSGSIKVTSELHKGSCFTVTLPLGGIHFPLDTSGADGVNLVASKNGDNQPYQYNVDSEKPSILVVEDNLDMIEFIRINLQEKYHLLTAENGEEAFQKANAFTPELIISDIMMPVMDGLTLCKKIKENPKTAHVGIILLTAKSLTSQKVEGIKMGADAYITKPFEMDILEASIEHLLKRKQELADYFRSELLTQPDPLKVRENQDDKFIRKVMNVIEANISNPELSVEMLSDEIGMSSTHLYRKLKSLTHLSGNEIIKKYRIKKASLLLKNKEGNITEMMYEVGFSNLSYFSKCFKAEFGLSPKDYQYRMSKSTINVENDLASSKKDGE